MSLSLLERILTEYESELEPLPPPPAEHLAMDGQIAVYRQPLAYLPGPAIYPAMLTGRCANGGELDRGTRVHALLSFTYWDYWQSTGLKLPKSDNYSLCGRTYGRRSAGWSEYESERLSILDVDCPRCKKRLGKFLEILWGKWEG